MLRLEEALDILLENEDDGSFCQPEVELLYAPAVDGVAGDWTTTAGGDICSCFKMGSCEGKGMFEPVDR